MKWKEFKEAVEALGVTDDTEIDWIDCPLMCKPKIHMDADPKTDPSIAVAEF